MLSRCVVLILLVIVGAVDAHAQRATPPLEGAGPFSAPVVEDGAIGRLQFVPVADGRGPDDLVIYDQDTGWVLLVLNHGIYGLQAAYSPLSLTYQIETVCWQRLEAGLQLAALQQDEDAREDLVGYHEESGKVYRYYRRGEAGTCH